MTAPAPIRPNPVVDRAISQALRQINTAASHADQTTDPRAAALHRLSESLLALLLAPSDDEGKAA